MIPDSYEPTDEVDDTDPDLCTACHRYQAHEDCYGQCGACYADDLADEAANRQCDTYRENR